MFISMYVLNISFMHLQEALWFSLYPLSFLKCKLMEWRQWVQGRATLHTLVSKQLRYFTNCGKYWMKIPLGNHRGLFGDPVPGTSNTVLLKIHIKWHEWQRAHCASFSRSSLDYLSLLLGSLLWQNTWQQKQCKEGRLYFDNGLRMLSIMEQKSW